MATTAFNLPQILPDQAQKHVPVNMSLDLIDAALAATVKSATVTPAPASPALGDRYIVPAGSTFGSVAAGNIAVWNAGAWHSFAAPLGTRVFVADEGFERIRTSAGWLPGQVSGAATGAGLGVAVFDRFVNLTGASVVAANLIPARAIVLGVTSWVVTAITGATSFSVGKAAGGSDFGAGLGVAVGSSNVGVVGPYATYAAAPVHVTAAGGNFTGGRIALAVSVLLPSPAPI